MAKTKTDPITYIETYLNDQPNAVVQLVAQRVRAYAKKRAKEPELVVRPLGPERLKQIEVLEASAPHGSINTPPGY